MFYRLKSLIKKLGAEKNLPGNPKPEILKNVFRTNHHRTALLSYLQDVFLNDEDKANIAHTNRYTTFVIAEVLNELGYNVDVINWNADLKPDAAKYQLVIGLGPALDHIIASRENASLTKVVWFGTGCNPLYSNVVTLERLKYFYERTGKLLMESARYIEKDWPLQHELSDAIILHGQSFARNTYPHQRVSCINGPVFIYHDVKRNEPETAASRNKFLWFGTGGLIHKGLDLTIDAFRELPGFELHIAGDLTREPGFYSHYRVIIENTPNIHYHGFLNIKSEQFAKVLSQCVFVIFPSASEGNSPSVLTCMANGGLIPVVTRSADVEAGNEGIVINELTVESVIAAIKESGKLSVEEIIERSQRISKQTRRIHSFEYFRQDLKLKLQELI